MCLSHPKYLPLANGPMLGALLPTLVSSLQRANVLVWRSHLYLYNFNKSWKIVELSQEELMFGGNWLFLVLIECSFLIQVKPSLENEKRIIYAPFHFYCKKICNLHYEKVQKTNVRWAAVWNDWFEGDTPIFESLLSARKWWSYLWKN